MPMRSKEDAPDYRYFPDPDLLKVHIEYEFLDEIEKTLPELPDRKMDRIIQEFGISKTDAQVLTRDKSISDFFNACAPLCKDKKRLSNWIIKELFRLLNDASLIIQECPIKHQDFADLINLMAEGDITDSISRTVLEEMFEKGGDPKTIINEKDLHPIHDAQVIESALKKAMKENPDAIAQVKAGETKPIDFLIGQVMKMTNGKVDPKKVRELILQKLT